MALSSYSLLQNLGGGLLFHDMVCQAIIHKPVPLAQLLMAGCYSVEDLFKLLVE
jgi:hypothetical protein